MSGYHAVTLPPKYSAGSIASIAYDTRVVALESGAEQRSARYNPWGRRKYTILRGITPRQEIVEMYEFFMLRQGSLNSFRFWDPLDHATTSTRTRHRVNDPPTSDTDVQLVFVQNRTYQCVVRYTDGVRTIVRPITKIGGKDDPPGVPTVGSYSLNGTFTPDDAVDPETGLVTFGGAVNPINFAEGGFEFLIPVRFADSTDQRLQIALQSTTETQELPGIDLIEEIDPRTTSQDYQYGGSKDWGLLTGDITTSEINGRVQCFDPEAPGFKVLLPQIDTVPDGGPIFVFKNLSNSNTLDIRYSTNAVLFTMATDSVIQLFVATISGLKRWVVLG